MPLTDSQLRGKATNPRDKRFDLHDRDGLTLEVHPSGRMAWRYRYTFAGRREKVTLGHYPAIGLSEARARRLEAERLVEHGQSPALAQRRERQRGQLHSVADLAERWLAEVLAPANKNSRQDETYIRRDVLPRIGGLTPSEVTTADVRGCVDLVLKRGHGQAARRVRNVLKRLFEYAAGHGLVRTNPALPIRPVHIAPTASRKRVLRTSEIRQFLDAVYSSRLAYQQKLALHFLLLVPARKGELVKARWVDVDLPRSIWDIPAESSKTAAPIRHRIPRQARELLEQLHELNGTSEWLLPSDRGLRRQPISTNTLNASLRTVHGLPDGIVLHDLRRTIRTGLGELGGVPDAVAELCLNHRPTGVAGIYDRSERIDERAVALQRWADAVDALRLEGGRVLAFRRTTL